MPRTVDLQLFGLALGAGLTTAGLAAWWRRRVSAVAILVALAVAVVGDRWLLAAVPSDLVDGVAPWAWGALTALAAGAGAARLPVAPTGRMPPVLPLALASLVGVWAGVPETSVAVVVAGVLVGVACALVVVPGGVTRSAAVVVGVAPVLAAVAGAVGEPHALAGGLLCSMPLAILAVGPRIRAVPPAALAMATALDLVAALVAARHVGIARDWDGAGLAVAVVLGLSVASLAVLREGQARAGA